MSDAIVDACCFINLYATGDLRGFLAELAGEWHMPSAALAESLYIRVTTDEGDDRREPIEPQPYIDESLITLVGVADEGEAELHVRLARDLDDGEAMALAIAKLRGWTLATDDRKAKRFAGDLGIPVVTTPELMKRWAKASKMRPARLKTLLSNIQSGARFAPAEDAPGYHWCTNAVGDAPSV
ncbi:MAG: PIN domain-containing protein [Phycisphaerae bacterium]